MLFRKHISDVDHASKLRKLFADGDADKNGSIGHDEFMDLMQDEKCRAYLEMKGLSLNDA